MNNHKRILSLILALILTLSSFTPVFAQTKTPVEKTRTGAQEVQIGDEIYYIFSADKNAKNDLIKSQEKSEKKTQAIQTSDGLDLSDNLFGRPVGAGRPASYTLNIKGNKFIGVGGKSFDWATLPEGFELQVFYIDENYLDVNIGNPITINESNYQDVITRTFDLAEQPLGFGFKTNVDTDTYLTDAYLTNESAPEPGVGSLDMTFDLVQVPSTKLDVKWVDVNQQPLARENTPATSLKDILTFNFIENKKFELPNQDKVDSYFRLNNKIRRDEVKDIKDATAFVDSKKDGEEVTLDGKIYKLTTSYDPALNEGSKIQLMYMPDVIDRTKNPESPTPDKYVRVTIDAGEGTKLAEGESKKVYDVRIGKALKAEHYPKLEISDSAKYKEPITWTIAPGTAITKAENIKGNAAKTAAETITAANLKAVDTTALQGQDFPEKFWNDGVALADTVPADKKDAFAALLKDATVTDITNPARTTAEAGDKVGTLLVTFKDGSKLEVPNQKLIVKPNTVTVAFDKAAGKEYPLRDGDTTVKGKITASSNSVKFPVSLDGAVVTIKKGNTVLTRTLANADGSFVAGVKDPLVAGENISVVVTLPESKTESAPVTEKVQLNPDKLNSIIPTGKEVFKNFDGKKGVNQDLVKALKAALDAADKLVDASGKVKSTVEVSSTGQKSLDDQYEAIKKAIEALTGNSAPEVTGTSHKEIFKGDALNLEDGIKVTDADGEADIDKTGGKAFTYAVQKVDAKGNKTPVTDNATINQTAGTYEVTYTAKDKSGAEGTFVMTLVVKEPVVEIKDNFPDPIPDGYVKVEFKEGAHGTLKGTTKFLVKDGSAKTVLNAPTIKPNANYEAKKNANWDPAIPETFTGTEENKKSFVFTAQYTYIGKDVVEQKPGDKKPDVPDNFVKVEFKKGDHGVISSEETTIYWVNPEKEVTLTAPTVTPSHGYKHTGWTPEVQANTKYTEAKEFVAQYKATVVTEDPHDTEHYAKVDFAAGDQGKFEQVGGKDQVTTFWVWKGEKVSFNAPKVTANENYKFKGWDKPIQETYDADTIHTATYESTLNISDTEVKGYQEVKFVSGNDGNFGKDNEQKLIKEKSLWVKPDTLVDLTDKAPTVNVTTTGKSFIGWDQKLVGKFAKADTATVINAKYDDTVKTTEPTENKESYAKVDFVAGNLGTIAADATKTYWVVKDAEVKLTPPTVTAKDGWKVNAEKPWDPAVATKYTKDTIHVAQYAYDGASVVPQKPGDEKPNVPDKFVKVEFKKGDHGVISSEETFIYWVDPTKEVNLTAPTVIPNTNYKHDGWKNGETVVDLTKANKFETTTDIVAQYKATVVTKDPKDPNYVTVEFDAKDHGTLTGDAKFWVYKNEKVSITAPTVTAKAGYTFDKWDPAVKDSYAEATVHNATYTTNNNVSDTEVEGYNKVTFKAGDHGTLTEKSVWVKPDTVVDLNDKAPEVTPAEGYSHIGWKPGLVGKFENNTDIVAQYSNNISVTPVEGWTELTFDQGDHGKLAKGAKNVKWVNPKAELKLSEIAPAIVADTNYSHDGWKDGETKVDLETAQKFETAKTFTATYKSNVLGKDEYDKLPDEEKKNFVQITFDKGANGKFPKEAVTEVYVKKDVAVDLTEKAPTVIPNQGYGHSGWEPALKGTFSTATKITAQYKEGTFDENAIKEIIVLGPTKMGYGEGEKLDLTGLKVIAKDDAGLQKTYDGLDAIKAAGFNIKPADKTELKMADNGKHIVVTKGEGNDKVEGQTETTLTIHENKSAKAENVKALNQNKVVDGKVTNEPKDTTTVTGKVTPGSTVKITDENGNDITPKNGVKVENDGTFTAEVKKQEEGKKVQVIVTEEGKQPSDPAEATVARDANNDGKADDDANQKTATPTAKALNVGKEPTVTTITGKAEPNAKVVAKVGDTIVGTATADNNGDYKIEATKTGKADGGALDKDTEVKVTAQADKKLVSDPTATVVKIDKDGNGVDDDKEKFDIKKATKVEIIKNPNKMDYLVNTPEGKAKFETKGLVVKFTDDSGKSATYTAEELAKMKDVTIKPANDEEIGLTAEGKTNKMDLTVTVTGAEATDKPTAKADRQVIVKLDADGNKTADEDEQTPEPTVTARNIGTDGPDGKKVPATKTTVEIKTEPNADVTIEYKDAQGQTQKIIAKADDQGKLTKGIEPKLDPDTEVKVTVKDGEKQPADKTVKVFEDLDDNKIPDTQAGQTERPAAIASNKGEAKDLKFTTIEGKTEKGATITVTVKVNGEEKPVTVENLKVNDDGTYTLEAKYDGKALENGAEIFVYAENAPKTISNPQTTTVFNDFNEDGKPDGGKVDLTKIQDIQVIDPNKMTYVEGTDGSLDLTGLKIVVRDTLGGIEVFNYDTNANKFKDGDTALDGFIVKVGKTEVAQGTTLTSADYNNKKITVAYGEKSGDTIQALKVTKTLPAPEVDPVKKGDTTVKVKVPTNGETKITVKVGDKEVVAEKDPQDGQWKVGTTPVNTVDGKLQIPVDELKQGDVVKVTTEDPAGNQGQAEKQVPVDEYSKEPTDLKAKNEPATPDKTTITGKATPGATVTIKDKNGNVLTTEPTPITAGQDGTFKATIDKKDPNTLLLVTTKEDGKEPSADVPVQVEGSSDVVPVGPGTDKPKGFVTVTFAIKDTDQAKGSLEGATAYYVNPKVDVQLNPPTFKAETGYKLDGWDQKDQTTIPAKMYTKDATITAVIGEVADVVPGKDPNTGKDNEKPAGYVEIEFAVDGSKGEFAANAETKFFVNPKKDVKLTAPGVTVTDPAYTMEGWDNVNWNGTDFDTAKYTSDTSISAKFKGSYVAPPKVDDVVTGDTNVKVDPGTADKVTVVVEGQGTVVVEKDPNGTWKTPDGKVVTPDSEGKLPVPVQPIGEKALVEVTVEKDGVVSEKVSKTAQKRIKLTVSNMEENKRGIIVQTYPAGATVTISLNGVVLIESKTDPLGTFTAILKNPKKAGENYTIKAKMDGYISEELTLPVIVK